MAGGGLPWRASWRWRSCERRTRPWTWTRALSAGSIETGGTVALIVTVTDPRGAVADPQFALPNGLEQLGSARSQQFSWVNGRSTNQVTSATSSAPRCPAGTASDRFASASAGRRSAVASCRSPCPTPRPCPRRRPPGRTHGRAETVASLVGHAGASPAVVGQACRLRVQLVQRVDMAEDSGLPAARHTRILERVVG